MTEPDYSGMKILFTAFSVSEGSEELAGYDYIKRHGATDITTFYWGDEAYESRIPDDVKAINVPGNNDFDPSLTEGYDLVFRHQTTRPDLIKSPTTTNTNEFFKYCPATIVAVTGTKGKGTTSTLISEILDSAGEKNRLLGNMGNTAIQQLDSVGKDELVIFEISSFQLWDLEHSPHVGVVLMMDVDHQDIHVDVDEYIRAKSNIVNHQAAKDLVIYHPTNSMTAQVVGEPRGRSKKYMTPEGAYLEDESIMIDGQTIIKATDVGLRGKHNLENVCAAITSAWEFTQNVEAIARAVSQFQGLEHRLEPVGDVGGVEYFNDSFSVVPVAAEAAVQSFTQPITLIVGGYDRGVSFEPLAKTISNSTVARVLVVGAVKDKLSQALTEAGVENTETLDTTEISDIVKHAQEISEPGSVVLLSPGCASFDMFANYKERGNKFKEAVHNL